MYAIDKMDVMQDRLSDCVCDVKRVFNREMRVGIVAFDPTNDQCWTLVGDADPKDIVRIVTQPPHRVQEPRGAGGE